MKRALSISELFILMLIVAFPAKAQIGIGIATPAPSAQLDVTATGKGLLVPRMTAANLPASPATGLIVYQTDGTPGFYYYNGSAWLMLSTAPAFNDTLTQNLYTNSYLLSADGTTGIAMGGNGQIVDAGTNSGTTMPSLGAGTRMIWNPGNSSFRAGTVTNFQWDGSNAGQYSTAIGYNTVASGIYATALGSSTTSAGFASTALGYNNTASGASATATGGGTTASGNSSTAMGDGTIASGSSSTAMGYLSTATADYATAIGSQANATAEWAVAIGASANASGSIAFAIGDNTSASGSSSLAMGRATSASAINSTAMGWVTVASGPVSTAMGTYVSTNGEEGSFAIGDASTMAMTSNNAANQMMMRFAGGYELFTDMNASVGVQIAGGGNSWSTISDRRKKENFAPVDGEEFLLKIRRFPLSSWNYKGQDATCFRHYGPMAQDFFAAFGRDSYGTSGNDTTISQADMEGVSFIAIQALEKRTGDLQRENEQLKKKVVELQADFTNRIERLEASIEKQPTAKDEVTAK